MTSTINLLSIILSVLALFFSLVAIVLVLAQKFSTHKIEWKPLETFDPLAESEKQLEEIEEEDEEFLKKALSLQTKKKKEKDPLEEILETNNF